MTSIPPSRFGFGSQAPVLGSYARDADMSRAAIANGTMQPVNPMAFLKTDLEKQQFLAKLGYAIDLDGVIGPQTSAAWKNYQAAIEGKKNAKAVAAWWSKNSKLSNAFKDVVKAAPKADPIVPAPPVVSTPASTGGTAATINRSAAVPTVRGAAGAAQPTAAGTNPYAAILAQMKAGLVNPQQYMNMMNQGTQSAVDLLQQELMRRQSAPASGVDDQLRKWYEAMIGQNNAGAGAYQANAQKVLGDYNAGTQGLANILGGSASPAASQVAAQGQIGATQLAENAQAQGRFDASNGANLALKGVEDRLANSQEEQSAQDDLRMQLIQAQADAAMGKGKNWLDALQLRGSQLNDMVDVKGLASMFGSDKALKNAQLTNANLTNAGLAQDYDINKIKVGLALQNAGTAGQVPAWGKLDPGKMGDLRTMLVKEVTDKTNTLVKNPMETYNAWGSVLRSLSHGRWNPYNNAEIDRWRDDLLSGMLPGWNAKHPKQKYAFRKGKLVMIP